MKDLQKNNKTGAPPPDYLQGTMKKAAFITKRSRIGSAIDNNLTNLVFSQPAFVRISPKKQRYISFPIG
jgi:hypothetical protein